MRIWKLMTAATLVLGLVGCKATVNSEVALSDLLNSSSKTIAGDLYVEVAGCNDYNDSRQPSKSVVDAKQQIPEIFPGAEYKECFRKKMDSYAHFSLPLFLDKDPDGKLGSNSEINLVSNKNVLLAVEVPKTILDRMKAAKQKMMGLSLNMNIAIKVKNDLGKDFAFNAMGVYVNGKPVISSNMTVGRGKAVIVNLSNVAVDAALEGSGAAVLFRPPNKA